MKLLINHWFEQSAPFEGIRACCIRHVDQTSVSKTWADGFDDLALDNAMRCIWDVYQVLQFNKIPPGRLRWVYEHALLHCERRADGACLGIFTLRDEKSIDRDGLARMFAEFQALSSKMSL